MTSTELSKGLMDENVTLTERDFGGCSTLNVYLLRNDDMFCNRKVALLSEVQPATCAVSLKARSSSLNARRKRCLWPLAHRR